MRISEGGPHQAEYGKGKSVPGVFPGQQEQRGWVDEVSGEWRLAGKGVRFCRTLWPLQELCITNTTRSFTELHCQLYFSIF